MRQLADTLPEELHTLLVERERVGLRVPLVARVVLLSLGLASVVGMLLAGVGTETNPWVNALVLVTLGGALGANAYFWRALRQSDNVFRVGVAGAVFDAAFAIALSGLAQLAGVADGLPVGYVFETELPVVTLTLIVVNGLALQPRYPLIVGAGAIIGLLIPLVRAFFDPLTEFSDDRQAVFAGPATDAGQPFTVLLMALGTTAAVTLSARAAQRTIRAGMLREVEIAQQQQAQLRAAMREKVGAIGKLVAGVSHEVNTPLGALRSSVDTQLKVFDKLASVMERAEGLERAQRFLRLGTQNLEGMNVAVDRIAQVEASLRALAHLDEAEFRKIDLTAELDLVVAAAERELPEAATIHVEGSRLPPLYVHATELNQALLTLLTHAAAAAGSEGNVWVTTSANDDAVLIDIEHDGPALSEEARARLFDVSLDHQGDRMGATLGLAAAQSVVLQHGGELTVASGEEGRTKLSVKLPLSGPG